MLGDRFPMEQVRAVLASRAAWHPFPTVEERGAWRNLPEATRAHYLDRGVHRLGFTWPSLPATRFLDFARDGNRTRYQALYSTRRNALRDLTLAECIEGEGRFLDDIVNGIWTICEETYWGVPAHLHMQRAGIGLPDVEEPTVDLFAAETAAQLAWTLYLLGERLDTVSPLVRRRIRYEIGRRILDPCLVRDDFWWMGFRPSEHTVNNWNPWVNSNWLTSVLLIESGAERRAVAVAKIMRSLDVFLGVYAMDGGCDEGPAYWGRAGASLFDNLDLLYKATDGAIDVFAEPKVANMGRYIYRAHIHGDYYVNFADAPAIVRPSGSLVYRYGRAVGDPQLAGFGAWLMARVDAPRGTTEGALGRILPALFDVPEPLGIEAIEPLPRDVWFEGVQVMVARDARGTPDGIFVAAKGGHNAESHNHNDVGSFIVYTDGRPLIIDVGVETYRRKTFSPQRYEIWTMQSAYHTLLPTVDGVMQVPGREFAARDVGYEYDEGMARLRMDLAGAYPPEMGLASWQRAVTLLRGRELRVEDSYVLSRAADAIDLGLLTPCEVEVAGRILTFRSVDFGPPGGTRRSGSGRMIIPAEISRVTVEPVAITDDRLAGTWGGWLTRVVFTLDKPALRGQLAWRIMPDK